jgi:hypothetical protein
LDLDIFKRDLLLQIFFAGLKPEREEYSPKLYIRSDWDPPLNEIPENCKNWIEHTISHLYQSIPNQNKHSGSNLSTGHECRNKEKASAEAQNTVPTDTNTFNTTGIVMEVIIAIKLSSDDYSQKLTLN